MEKVLKFTLTFVFMNLMIMSGSSVQAKNSKKNLAEVTFNVNMVCHGCQTRIEKNIPWEKGVKDLKVDLEKKTVTVTYDSLKTNEANLRKSIENLNFVCTKAENGK